MKLRPPKLDDLPALVAFFAAMQEAHGTGGWSEGDIRDRLTSPLADPEQDLRVALSDGDIVGWVGVWDQNRTHERFFLDVRAFPRDRVAFGALLDWGEDCVRESAQPHALVRASAADDNEVLAGELRSRGFRVVRHFLTMEINLEEEPPAPAWPEGIQVRTFRPDDARAAYEVSCEAFEDHWDFVRPDYAEWRAWAIETSDFDPSLCFLAEDDGAIAGFAFCRTERRPGVGHVAVLGVRRPWRRRGLATALVLHGFHELRRRGRTKADLGVDAENLTGAVRLYERVGMHVACRFDTYEKEVAGEPMRAC